MALCSWITHKKCQAARACVACVACVARAAVKGGRLSCGMRECSEQALHALLGSSLSTVAWTGQWETLESGLLRLRWCLISPPASGSQELSRIPEHLWLPNYLVSCVIHSYTLKCQTQSDFGKVTMQFELEVCQLQRPDMVGIRRQRLKGDAWVYKRLVEDILAGCKMWLMWVWCCTQQDREIGWIFRPFGTTRSFK